MAKTFSLCLTTQKLRNTDKPILFRVADIIENELQQYNFYDQEIMEMHEENSNPYPYTSPANYVLGELRIWEWDPRFREWAKRSLIPFYELIDTYDFVSLNEEAVVNILKKGQAIPNYVGQKALLVIQEYEDDYKVIEVESNILYTSNGIAKLNKTVKKINCYLLSKKDFLSTEKVVLLDTNGEKLPSRRVYKKLNVPQPIYTIDALTFNEKLELFITKQIKTRNYSKAQQRDLKNLFMEIITDYDTINEFFIENEFDNYNLEQKIGKVLHLINDTLGDNCLWDEFIKVMIENQPELTDKYIRLIEERFCENNKKRLESIDREISEKEGIRNDLIKQCSEYEFDISVLEKKKLELEVKVKEIEVVYNSLTIAVQNKAKEIKENMAGFLSEITLLELLGFNVKQNIEKDKISNIKTANINKTEIDILYDINEFVDTLSVNLKIAGIESENKLIVSKYITGSIIQKNALLLVGKYTHNISDAISATICGMESDIISITSPNINIDEITKQINNCNSKVVLIENIVNQNENVTLQLLRNNYNKLIIYAIDISEMVSFIPNSMLSWFNLLCLDFICERILHEKFDYTDASKVNFENKCNTSTYKAAKEEIKKLIGKFIYSSAHCATKAELTSIIDDIGEEEGIYSWLLCEVIPHKILTNDIDTLEEEIDILQLSEKHTNKLKSMLGRKI